MVNYSFGAPARFYPRGSGSARRHPPCASLSASAGASVAATFAACRCPRIGAFPLQSADPLAGHGCRNNRDGSRTIRTRPEAVKTFFQNNFRVNFARFFCFSRYLKTSSTGNFHRWKSHGRFVEIFSTFLSNTVTRRHSFIVFVFVSLNAEAPDRGTGRARGCDFSAPSFIIISLETHQIIRSV